MKARTGLLIAVALACIPAAAQTLYKLIDKNGKVTYVDSPPKNFDGQVIPIDVDPNRNRATLGVNREVDFSEKARAQDAADARVKQAQEKLDAARKNLAFARDNPQEGEIERMGNAKGGTRPVPTEAYEKRIAKLEEAVRVAEEELKQAQRPK